VAFVPRDGLVGRPQVAEGRAIDVQHREILESHQQAQPLFVRLVEGGFSHQARPSREG
jgi:hypothetical protein